MINKIILAVGCLLSLQLDGQTPVVVVESTMKLGVMGEEIFYLGFAEGDKIVFDFEVTKGKDIKELEILEMPSTSRFMDYKSNKIVKKIISVPSTAIYKFRFTSSSVLPRICSYKIQRIPASEETQNFNTAVSTHTIYDTTYFTEQEQFMEKIDTVITNYQDRMIRVNPISDPDGNKASFNFILPDNVIGWSYYLYTDQDGLKEFEDANSKFKDSEISTTKKFPTFSILAGLILNKPATIKKIQSGHSINYWIMEGENVNLFTKGEQFRYMQKGSAPNDYGRVDPRKGILYFCFSNDNKTEFVNVSVKITLIQVNDVLQTRDVKKILVTPKTEMYIKD